ncbi:MAG: hypothetical protein KAT15_23585 [Bacteroidales bacterium]|nr:hypothetical protein [Bacteroidales bacterium]
MSRLTFTLGVIICLCLPTAAQVNNSLFFMHGVPQSNRINPAYQPNCGFYLGFPMLAPLRMELSSSSLAYGDVIYPHPTADSLITFLHPLGSKQDFLELLQPLNFVVSDLGTSIASIGFRTKAGFFSLDVTTRVEGTVYYPGDLFRLMINGASEGVTYQLDGIGVDLAVFDEASVGWSAEIIEGLQVGARAKVLFGVGSLSTARSDLAVTTSQENWNIQSDMMFNASLPFAEVQYDADGMIEDVVIDQELENLDWSSIPRYVFNTKNLGLGVDVGINYRPIEPLQISISALDIGYINWKDEVHEVSYQTEFDFNGLEINPFDYIGDDAELTLDSTISLLGDSLSNFLQFTPGGAFSKRLNTKLYAGASYYVTPNINFGILSRTDFLNGKIAQQFTASANFTTGRFINFTASYSYTNATLKNIGAGFSLNAGPFNLYVISDNVVNTLLWPHEVRSVNLWFGMNLVFGYQKTKKKDGDRPLIY